MNRTRRAGWNFLTNVLFYVVTSVTSVLATPWLVHWLGKEKFGAYRVTTDWYGWLMLLDLGLGAAIGPLFARALNQDNQKALQGTMAAGVRFYAVLVFVMLGVGLGLTPFVDRLVRVPDALASDLRTAWIVMVCLGVLPLALTPFKALADAAQLAYRVNLLFIAQSLFILGLSLRLASVGGGLTGQALANTAVPLVISALLAWDGLRRHPGMLRAVVAARPDPEAVADLRRLSPPTLVMNLCGRLNIFTDYIIVNQVLASPNLVTNLFVTQRLANMTQGILQAISASSWAGLAELYNRNQLEAFNQRLIELTRVIVIMGLTALAPIVAYNHHFLALWMGPYFDGGLAVTIVAAINAILLAILSLWNWCFTGTGQVHRIVPMAVIGAVVNFGLSVVLTWQLGIVGPLLGTTIGMSTIWMTFLPALLRTTFGTRLRDLAWAIAVPFLYGVPYTLLLSTIAHAQKPLGWIALGAQMSVGALVFLLFSGFVLVSPTDRRLWLARLRSLLPRRAAGVSS